MKERSKESSTNSRSQSSPYSIKIGPLEISRKQKEVLDLLILNYSSKEMARYLSISPKTVDQRLDTVRDRFGFSRRNQLAQFYRGLLEQEVDFTESNIPTARLASGEVSGWTTASEVDKFSFREKADRNSGDKVRRAKNNSRHWANSNKISPENLQKCGTTVTPERKITGPPYLNILYISSAFISGLIVGSLINRMLFI